MNAAVTKAKQDVQDHAIDAWNSMARGLTRGARLVIAILIFFLVGAAYLLDSVDQWLQKDSAVRAAGTATE